MVISTTNLNWWTPDFFHQQYNQPHKSTGTHQSVIPSNLRSGSVSLIQLLLQLLQGVNSLHAKRNTRISDWRMLTNSCWRREIWKKSQQITKKTWATKKCRIFFGMAIFCKMFEEMEAHVEIPPLRLFTPNLMRLTETCTSRYKTRTGAWIPLCTQSFHTCHLWKPLVWFQS